MIGENCLLADCPYWMPTLNRWLQSEWLATSWISAKQVDAILMLRNRCHGTPIAFVAIEDEYPIGMASLVETARPDSEVMVPCLSGLYVAPNWRRRGVGAALCSHVLDEAHRLQQPTVGLYTLNKATYYARLGWIKRCDTIVDTGACFALATFHGVSVTLTAKNSSTITMRLLPSTRF